MSLVIESLNWLLTHRYLSWQLSCHLENIFALSLFVSYFSLQKSSWTSKHRSARLFWDGILIGSMTGSILLRQASYKTLPTRSYIRVCHTRSRGNVLNYKGLRSISIYTEYFVVSLLVTLACARQQTNTINQGLIVTPQPCNIYPH